MKAIKIFLIVSGVILPLSFFAWKLEGAQVLSRTQEDASTGLIMVQALNPKYVAEYRQLGIGLQNKEILEGKWHEKYTPQDEQALNEILQQINANQCEPAANRAMPYAEQGRTDFQLLLGWALQCKSTNKEQFRDVLYWHREAALAGNPMAQYEMGLYYSEGIIKLDYREARVWYEKSYAQGNLGSAYQLAQLYSKGNGVKRDLSHSFMLIEDGAKKGYALSQGALGLRYLKGEGVEKDVEKGQQWLEASAEQGDVHSQFNLGMLYLKLNSRDEALHWFLKAADEKHVPSMIMAATVYESGRWGKPEPSLACEMYKHAAIQHFTPAIYKVGKCAENETQKDHNATLAYAHYFIAAEKGDAFASIALDRLQSQLSEEEKKRAEIVGRELLPVYFSVP